MRIELSDHLRDAPRGGVHVSIDDVVGSPFSNFETVGDPDRRHERQIQNADPAVVVDERLPEGHEVPTAIVRDAHRVGQPGPFAEYAVDSRLLPTDEGWPHRSTAD